MTSFSKNAYIKSKAKKRAAVFIMLTALIVLTVIYLFAGSSNMSADECIKALLYKGSEADNRIIWNIRIPRMFASVIAGAGLSVSGLIMQTTMGNAMASPSTLGVSNAAVFGANLSIIAFAGGFLSTGNNLSSYTAGANPYLTSFVAFIFAALSVLAVLGVCKTRSYKPDVVVLAGIAIGSVWTAATTVLQFFATDVGLSAGVIWTFGDLGRATYKTNAVMLAVVALGCVFFLLMPWKYNALLSGDSAAAAMGVNVNRLRFASLLAASLITAVCVSFLGIIGFVGIICPHIAKKLLGHDHRYTTPASILGGSILLLLSDMLAKSLGNGSALPVGAITTLLGAPFFIAVIFYGKEKNNAYD